MNRPPPVQTAFENIPVQPQQRHEFLVDVFGRHLFWAMQDVMLKSRDLVSSPDARARLGRIFEQPYANVAKLTPDQQEVAFNFARQAMENVVKRILIIMEAQGTTFQLGDRHAVQYRLTTEIRDIESMEIQLEDVINRGGEKALSSHWGRWLNQNANEKNL